MEQGTVWGMQTLWACRRQIFATGTSTSAYPPGAAQMQLKQAMLQSPQQIEDILHQQQQQQQQQASSANRTKAQQATTSTAAAAADKMDVDQPAEQQDQQAAKEVSAAIMQQHASFLAQLTGGPS